MLGVRGIAFVLAVAVALVGAAAVQADRKPTAKERADVADVIDLPARCAAVRISTETKKPIWASVSWKPGPSECEPLASDGVTVARKKSGRWRFVTAGSDFDCPALYRDVPQNVVRDLGITCH